MTRYPSKDADPYSGRFVKRVVGRVGYSSFVIEYFYVTSIPPPSLEDSSVFSNRKIDSKDLKKRRVPTLRKRGPK